MHAMLTLDLDRKTTTEQREKFNEHLKKDQWIKIPGVTTTWRVGFSSTATEAGIITTTKNDVSNAARSAGISSYNAVVHVGESNPTEF